MDGKEIKKMMKEFEDERKNFGNLKDEKLDKLASKSAKIGTNLDKDHKDVDI